MATFLQCDSRTLNFLSVPPAVLSVFKRVSQDAVVQVGWRLELTPLQAGKRRGQRCPGLKLTSGRGVERTKVTVQRAGVKTSLEDGGGGGKRHWITEILFGAL